MTGFANNISEGRFSMLLSKSDCPRPLYDQVLARLHGCVVTPTRGSIIPNWLLIIPEEPVLNFAKRHSPENVGESELVTELLQEQGIDANRAIWFEHGPAQIGSSVGCGVDHAHIHVLIDAPFSFAQMVSRAEELGQLQFARAESTDAYSHIRSDNSYLLLASANEARFAENVEKVGSQFLRRVIADLVGCKDDWNYRTHPHFHNVQKTIQCFSAA